MATQNLKCTSSPGAEKHGVANSLAFLSDSPNASSPANRTNTIFKDKCQTVGNSSDVPQDIGINDSMRPPPPTPPRYQKWTIEEEEALCAGVEKHGIGNWQTILSDPQFASTLVNRSNIKLKDKWRTLSTISEMSDNKQRVRARRIKESMHSPTPLPPTPRYQKWTAEEEVAFCAGVEKHGIRNWQAIRSDPKFASTLVNRSNINLKDKWRTLSRSSDVSNNKRKVTACRIDDLMHPRQHSTKKISGKREVEEVSNSQDCPVKEVSDPHDFPVKEVNDPQDCPVDGVSDPQDCPVDEVSDPQDFPVEEVSDPQDFLVEEVSDSEDCPADEISDSHGCPVDKVSDSQYCPVDEGSESDVYLIEELSNSQDHHSSCTNTGQRRVSSENVHGYLEKLWLSFPEDKKSSFTHINPLWYNLYLNDSNREKVLNLIKKKDIFSRKYVFLPIFLWGHWSVVIFCHFGESFGWLKLKTPCILLLDSLGKADHSKQLETAIRKFVLDIYEISERKEDKRLGSKMPFLVPKVPQQRDQEESAFYALYYIKLFVESAPPYIVTSNFMKKDWANSEGLDSFRRALESWDV